MTSNFQPLTSLTNEQIVAELGWTREAIKTVLGVTPTTMRPPYGDIGGSGHTDPRVIRLIVTAQMTVSVLFPWLWV